MLITVFFLKPTLCCIYIPRYIYQFFSFFHFITSHLLIQSFSSSSCSLLKVCVGVMHSSPVEPSLNVIFFFMIPPSFSPPLPHFLLPTAPFGPFNFTLAAPVGVITLSQWTSSLDTLLFYTFNLPSLTFFIFAAPALPSPPPSPVDKWQLAEVGWDPPAAALSAPPLMICSR